MVSARLQLNDVCVGLRHVSEDIFVPRSNASLETLITQFGKTKDKYVVITYSNNNESTIMDHLKKICEDMVVKDWMLVVIDNDSTDNTWGIVKDFKPDIAADFLYLQIDHIDDRSAFIDKCSLIAQEYINSDTYTRLVHNPSAKFKEHTLESFCFMATKNVIKEAILLVYSIRCFHNIPIYIVCDDYTKHALLRLMDCSDVYFECSAGGENLDEIKDKYADEFARCSTGYHRMECLYHKIQAMEFALSKVNNTLFLDSDIIITNKITDSLYKDIIMSPHYWGAKPQYGIFNAGYIFSADRTFVDYWRDIFLNESMFLEQEGMNKLCQYYDYDLFSKDHNIGFWRTEGVRDLHGGEYKSFHVHTFNDEPYKEGEITSDIARSLNNNHNALRTMMIDYLHKSKKSEHKLILDTINKLRNHDLNSLTKI